MTNSLVNYSEGGNITYFTAKFSLRILPFTHKTNSNRSGLFKTMTTLLLFCPQSILMIVSTVRPKKSSFSRGGSSQGNRLRHSLLLRRTGIHIALR